MGRAYYGSSISCVSATRSRAGRNNGKRVRTIFTQDQLDRLEKEFERQQYMVGTERCYLAAQLGLVEAQVKVWFQNRRIKWRRQAADAQRRHLASAASAADTGATSGGLAQLSDYQRAMLLGAPAASALASHDANTTSRSSLSESSSSSAESGSPGFDTAAIADFRFEIGTASMYTGSTPTCNGGGSDDVMDLRRTSP